VVDVVESLGSGRYELLELVGAGGAGSVRRAHDRLLDRDVAVKTLRGGVDETERARMRAEAQLAGSLHHPGVAQVYDYGEEPPVEGGPDGPPQPFIVMQYVEGTSLWHRLREQRTLSPVEVMGLVAQVADALQAAHAAGIVHRDLKPANMLLTPEGRVVLVDFGIARSDDIDPLTRTGTIVGTADYISPEQAEGRPATSRSDLYALGMVAYECLTGRKPFRREHDVATALAHLRDDAPPLPPEVPAPVRALVEELIAKDPDQRPAEAAEVAARAGALAVSPVSAPPRRDAPELTPLGTLVRRATRRPVMRSRQVQLGAAVLVAAVAGSSLVAARQPAERHSHHRGERPVATPAAADRDEVRVSPEDLVGETYREAARQLARQGLVPRRAERPRPSGTGRVLFVQPTGPVPRGTEVTLTVAVPGGR
jgi:serine/threonine-protein kinase